MLIFRSWWPVFLVSAELSWRCNVISRWSDLGKHSYGQFCFFKHGRETDVSGMAPLTPWLCSPSAQSSPLFLYFYKVFFLMWTMIKVFVEFTSTLFLGFFMFWFFSHKACRILAPGQGSNLHPLRWKVKS